VLEATAGAVNRQIRSHRGWSVAAAAAVPLAVGAIAARRKLAMHPALTLPLGCVPPLGMAIAVPKGRTRRGPSSRHHAPGCETLDHRAVTAVYGSWFVPQLLLGYLLANHPEYVARAGARLSAAYHLTCPFYFLAPEAPPWWASEKGGRMNGEIERVGRIVVYDLLRREPPGEEAKLPGNPWGSMPSDHISSAAITAMGLAEVSPLYGALGWSYVAAASFAVVYLGEHYVLDVVVGLLIAEAVRRAEPLAAPFVRAVARAVE